MLEQFARTELLLGKEAMERLSKAHVAVFGIGGVGGYVAEALARCGVGRFDFIDNDKVCLTNLNRQIIATTDTIGRYKVEVMKERILSVNPAAEINTYTCFYLPENAQQFDFKRYSYVVDAIDTVTAKISLVLQAKEAKVPIISCMGTGNKLNPTMLTIADIYETSVCPLAKVMRRELRRRNVESLKVLYSKEEPKTPGKSSLSGEGPDGCKAEREEPVPKGRRSLPGSVSFVPPAAGLIIASEVVKDLTAQALSYGGRQEGQQEGHQ